jgi:hypothetical protein
MSEAAEISASRGRAMNANSLANLRPWVKGGPSGNPSGRAPALVDIAALAREHGPRCIDVAVALLDDPDPRIRLATVTALLDRGFGKPMQTIGGGDDAAGITFLHLIAARASSDALNGRVIDSEHTVVDTDETMRPTSRNLMEPATE